MTVMTGMDDLAAIELRAMRAAWIALAGRWGLTPRERAELLPAGGEDEAGPPQDTERRMRILIEVGYRTRLAEDELRLWLRMSTEVLGGLTPLDAMSGSLADLRGVRHLVEQGFAS